LDSIKKQADQINQGEPECETTKVVTSLEPASGSPSHDAGWTSGATKKCCVVMQKKQKTTLASSLQLATPGDAHRI
jgi:hypothetical protein